jgi:hypothetical protein
MLEVEAFPSVVCPVTERVPVATRLVVEKLDEDALPSVDCPTTLRVPCEVREEVAVMSPPVRVLMVAVRARKRVAKRLDEVALVKVELVATRLVVLASVV